MTALTTTANLVEPSALGEDTRLTATLERSDVEALLAEGHPQLWFELGTEGEADPYRLTVELTEEDLRALLAGSSGDEILLSLDGEELAEGGLGIAIIRSIADEVEIGGRADGRGSRLRFVKLL